MTSYAHKKLIEEIARLDELPADDAEFSRWIEAGDHLNFLRANADADEVVIYASGPYAYVHSIAVPVDLLIPESRDGLLAWSCNPFRSIASYVYGGGRDDVWVERGGSSRGSDVLNAGTDLVFGRTFEGWSGDDRDYMELNQEFAHLTGIHLRPEHRTYCRFDENGDLEHVVSMTTRNQTKQDVSLVSFEWTTLEQYLAMSRMALVRMFDFTLLKRNFFRGWPRGPEDIVVESNEFAYRRKLASDAAYTRGFQIIPPRRVPAEIMNEFKNGSGSKKKYVEYIAHDWRNKRLARISTDPELTTNYFDAKEGLPFELSAAFFRPEVLSKYKTDREKYTVGEREISCRAAWHLRGYDVNEAGQVHAYICDLRKLPYSEQLHWLAHNEEPTTGISERAFTTDFKGEFTTLISPREKVLSILRRWNDEKVSWWSLRDEDLLKLANAPLTASKDEWGEAMMDLSKLIAEGFELKAIRQVLNALTVPYGADDKSIALLEKVVGHAHSSCPPTLAGLRTVQFIRSKVRGHAGSSEAKAITAKAIADHGSFAAHYQHVCDQLAAELETIERTFGGIVTLH